MLDRDRDLKLFYKEFIAEEFLYPDSFYTDKKTFYPFQVIDLRQVDHITPKKIQIFD